MYVVYIHGCMVGVYLKTKAKPYMSYLNIKAKPYMSYLNIKATPYPILTLILGRSRIQS